MRGAFLVIGASGSGKTSVAQELMRLGYNAVSADKAICGFVDLAGSPVQRVDIADPTWQERYRWVFNLDRLDVVLEQYRTSYVFICGNGANRSEVLPLVKQVFFLDASANTLTDRVASRGGSNQMGKLEFQRKALRERAPRLREEMRKAGAVFIDAEQPLERVADEIIRQAAI